MPVIGIDFKSAFTFNHHGQFILTAASLNLLRQHPFATLNIFVEVDQVAHAAQANVICDCQGYASALQLTKFLKTARATLACYGFKRQDLLQFHPYTIEGDVMNFESDRHDFSSYDLVVLEQDCVLDRLISDKAKLFKTARDGDIATSVEVLVEKARSSGQTVCDVYLDVDETLSASNCAQIFSKTSPNHRFVEKFVRLHASLRASFDQVNVHVLTARGQLSEMQNQMQGYAYFTVAKICEWLWQEHRIQIPPDKRLFAGAFQDQTKGQRITETRSSTNNPVLFFDDLDANLESARGLPNCHSVKVYQRGEVPASELVRFNSKLQSLGELDVPSPTAFSPGSGTLMYSSDSDSGDEEEEAALAQRIEQLWPRVTSSPKKLEAKNKINPYSLYGRHEANDKEQQARRESKAQDDLQPKNW